MWKSLLKIAGGFACKAILVGAAAFLTFFCFSATAQVPYYHDEVVPIERFRLRSIQFLDSRQGTAVGNQGVVLDTSDGGLSWRFQNVGTPQTLRAVRFNGNAGWIVGDHGSVFRRFDSALGGWRGADSDLPAVPLTGVGVLDSDTALVVGTDIFRTQSGGLNWKSTRLKSDLLVDVSDIFFTGRNSGWAVGAEGTILATTNGGATWDFQKSNVKTDLSRVFFFGQLRGWAIGGNTVLTTRNGGQTWQPSAKLDAELTSLAFISPRIGWIAGRNGLIWRTLDSGDSWQLQKLATPMDVEDISFIDESVGWVVGDGPIQKTENGGKTWTLVGKQPSASLLVYSRSLISSNSWWLAISLTLGSIAAGYLVNRNLRNRLRITLQSLNKERERLTTLKPSFSPSSEADSTSNAGVVPEIPGELLLAASQEDVVLVMGAGVSAQASLPTAQPFWLSVLDEVGSSIDPETLALIKEGILNGDPLAIETLRATAGRDRILGALKAILAMPSDFGSNELHQILRRGNWRAVVGLTWDDLDVSTFEPNNFVVVRAEDSPGIGELLRSKRPFLMKPLGDIRKPETIALTWQDYREVLERWPDLVQSLTALYSTQTLLFVGLSRNSIEQFLNALPPRISPQRTHYALVPADRGNAVWQAGMGKRFNIQLLAMNPSPGWPELPTFMRNLVESSERQKRLNRGDRPRQLATRAIELRKVQLENVGLFEAIELDFPTNWTLLLGGNGCGKSTVLKAIGLALCGTDPRVEAAAQRLLRRKDQVKTGKIKLKLSDEELELELVRHGDKVRLLGPPTTPVMARSVLAIGTPALRGIATRSPSGYLQMDRSDPSPDDLLPLVSGPYDVRLESFMQWALNAKIAADRDPNGPDAGMVQTLEKLIGAIIPPHPLRLVVERSDSGTLTLLVDNGLGSVPFESISQGMSSIFNWVGVLLQRLYDVFPNSPHPEKQPALILIDEIDAHLHPDWQRRLVELVQDHFPNVQVIATSHSPLVAGALEQNQIRVLRDGKAYPVGEDLKGKSAQDIMMSAGFALRSPRATVGEKEITRYLELFAKQTRNKSEEVEFRVLASRFGELNYGTSNEENRVRQAVEEVLRRDGASETISPNTRFLIEKELGAAAVDFEAGNS